MYPVVLSDKVVVLLKNYASLRQQQLKRIENRILFGFYVLCAVTREASLQPVLGTRVSVIDTLDASLMAQFERTAYLPHNNCCWYKGSQ